MPTSAPRDSPGPLTGQPITATFIPSGSSWARAHELPDGMKVAVMGCPVNGPGESRGADVGIAAGVHQGLLFVGGKSVARYREDELVDALVTAAREYQGDRPPRPEGGEAP